MGMFDTVNVTCPNTNCGEVVEFQSKAGDCDLAVYNLYDAPVNILLDIVNDSSYCVNCKLEIRLLMTVPPIRPILMPYYKE